MDSRALRTVSRGLLKGKWSLAIAVSLVLCGCLMLLSFALDLSLFLFGMVDYETNEILPVAEENEMALLLFYAGLFLAWLFLVEPLELGAARFFFALANGATPSVATLFYAFSREWYGRALVMNTILSFKKAGRIILCMLPGAALSGVSPGFGGFLMTVGFVVALILNLRYAAVRTVFAADETLPPHLAVKTGVKLMKGNKSDLFVLNFSFIGWFLLAVPTIGISLMHTVPYVATSHAVFFKRVFDLSAEQKT